MTSRVRWQKLRLVGLGSLGAAIDTVAQAIQKQEGYYPGSVAYRNNNPGNLIYTSYYATQFGAVKGTPMKDQNGNVIGYFSSFPDYQSGLDALDHQITVDASSGLSIQGMMSKYAPAVDANGNPTGNNPALYAQNVASALGVDPGMSLEDALAGGSGSTSVTSAPDYTALADPTATDAIQSAGAIDWGVVALVGGLALVLALVAD